jgi:hypothetical protein
MRRVTSSKLALSTATLSALMLLAAACGSGGSSPGDTGTGGSSSSASASPAPSRPTPVLTVCQDVNSVRAALKSLVSTSITEAGVSEIQAVARGMEASVADLGQTVSGRTEWRSQVDALKSAVVRLQSAASSYAAAPSREAGVSSAKANVAVAARRLLATVGNRCPSPPATPAPSS